MQFPPSYPLWTPMDSSRGLSSGLGQPRALMPGPITSVASPRKAAHLHTGLATSTGSQGSVLAPGPRSGPPWGKHRNRQSWATGEAREARAIGPPGTPRKSPTPPTIAGKEVLTECPSGRRPGNTLAAHTRDALPPTRTLCLGEPCPLRGAALACSLLPSVHILGISNY